jgi:ring-1,2-phenylacetyl-CoA epoxidase subunit PaaC
MFEMDEVDMILADAGVGGDVRELKEAWKTIVDDVMEEANLTLPTNNFMMTGSKEGMHTEALGHMLAEMQFLPRAYPDAKW